MSNSNLLELLSKKRLLQLAGPQSYSRGEAYFENGRVTGLHIEDNFIRAQVAGTKTYRTKLWIKENSLEWSCTCPLFESDEVFCKHLVAISLAAQESSSHTTEYTGSKSKARPLTSSDVEQYLLKQDKKTLVAILMEQARSDDGLYDNLRMKAAISGNQSAVATLKHTIREAVGWDGFVDYRSAREYTRGLYNVIASISEYLEHGNAAEVIDLTEYFLKQLEVQMNYIDDSDGFMSDILIELQEIHYRACKIAKPDPGKLAKKLFNWELNSDWEIFYGSIENYSDILGEKGKQVYRDLAEKEWNKIPSIGHEKEHVNVIERGNRFRITKMMEALARQSGDVEQLVAIKAKDLSLPYFYLEIAEIYKEAGEKDKALEWAEQGMKKFPKHGDTRLCEFLADEYQRRKHFDDAIKLIWQIFTEHQDLENYKLLKKHAARGGKKNWKQWREKALDHIRKEIKKRKAQEKKNRWLWNAADHSILVRIYLWEKNTDQAWQEAQQGGCSEELWFKLAKLREKEFPEDALSVYQTFVDPTINQKNNQAYREAIDILKKIKQLFIRLNRPTEWENFLETIKAAHKPKRNLMKLLNKEFNATATKN